MIGCSSKCGQLKAVYSVLGLHHNIFLHNIVCNKQRNPQRWAAAPSAIVRYYAKDDSGKNCHGCCKDTEQQGRRAEPWPKGDVSTPVPWRCECPSDYLTKDNDPYRIRVPNIEVPPMPPSNAKCGGTGPMLYQWQSDHPGPQQGYQGPQQGYSFPQQQFDEQGNPIASEESGQDSGGLLGILKGIFRRKNRKNEENAFNQIMPCPISGEGVPWREQTAILRELLQPPEPPAGFSRRPDTKEPRLCYHGLSKYKMAFHEPWNPLDRLTLITKAERETKGIKHNSYRKENKLEAATAKLK